MVSAALQVELEELNAFLSKVTPTNIHRLTNASYGQKVNFESVWYGHGPQAARYYLLPELFFGTLLRKGSERAHSPTRDLVG